MHSITDTSVVFENGLFFFGHDTCFLKNGSSWFQMHVDDENPPAATEIAEEKIAQHIRMGNLPTPDVVRDITLLAAHKRVKSSIKKDDIIFFFLNLFDEELSDKTRKENAQVLIEELGDVVENKEYWDFLRNIVYSKPFPREIAVDQILSVCDVGITSYLGAFIMTLALLQNVIKRVDDALKKTVGQSPIQPSYEVISGLCARCGLTRVLVETISYEKDTLVTFDLNIFDQKSQLSLDAPEVIPLIRCWIELLKKTPS